MSKRNVLFIRLKLKRFLLRFKCRDKLLNLYKTVKVFQNNYYVLFHVYTTL